MKKLIEWTFQEVIEKTSSNSATPGGGSVSALAGALGSSLVAMIGSLSLGKNQCPDQAGIEEILRTAQQLSWELAQEGDLDIVVFNEVMRAYGLPKSTEEEVQERKTEIQKALKNAAETPLKTGKTCLEVVKLALRAAEIGNPNATSDAIAGGLLAEAALQSVLLNVKVNVQLMSDSDLGARLFQEVDHLSEEGMKARAELLQPDFWKK